MEKVVVKEENDIELEKKQYLKTLFRNNPKLGRQYNEVLKYCKIVKKDLDNLIFDNYSGGDLSKFLEEVFRETLIVFFTKMLQFENIDNEEELYNTLYYISYEYIKIVKKDTERKDIIDKNLPDLKVLVEFFSSQALTKESFKSFDLKNIDCKRIIGFLLENTIKTYQSKGKIISKEESEATIVYSLINLYMSSELERFFLIEHLEQYKNFKKEYQDLDDNLKSINDNLQSLDKESIDIDLNMDVTNIQLEKVLNHNKLMKQLIYKKKITKLENTLKSLERKADSILNQTKTNKNKAKTLKSKLTKLENEFKNKIKNDLDDVNNYYQMELIINLEDFENKNKLKKKSITISKDIIERLQKINIIIENRNLNLNDYIELKKTVNDYKMKFSNKNLYHNKIVKLLDKYGYYLKN